MRKQYHLSPGGRAFDAWDVDRLIRLSADLPVVEVPVSSFRELDTPHWWMPGDAPLTVNDVITHMRLVRDVDPAYPVILGSDGRVMDGMHRIARAVLEERETIRAVRFPVDPEPDVRNCRPEDLPYDDRPDRPGHP
ncbi:hypothetical protein DQ239_05720 [Blastococcus sp. TF02-09]|uniref:hypothetical protein n=1 Tax=Blastococcus sp. TF02-09 TaxID=2250576 RepID=UPI000DEA8ED0|nr:hypothetical protein [Blastococcus sp. TF02-9]RBY79155.1 hypothetical protein DQ239_05720 [Blastococcus sp. TF02-9]